MKNFLKDDGAKLVQYSRDDVSGPKLSKFNILEVTNGKLLEQMLDESIGILGALDKTRYLFIHEGRTRIHLDIVKNKGTEFFGMEFEVTLKEEDNLSLGTEIAEKLMKSFKLSDDQLLQGSYFELLNPKSK